MYAYDIRPETKEQQSHSAPFIDSEDEKEDEGEEDAYEEYQPTGWRKLMTSLELLVRRTAADRYIVEGEGGGRTEEDEGWSQEKLDEDQKLIGSAWRRWT